MAGWEYVRCRIYISNPRFGRQRAGGAANRLRPRASCSVLVKSATRTPQNTGQQSPRRHSRCGYLPQCMSLLLAFRTCRDVRIWSAIRSKADIDRLRLMWLEPGVNVLPIPMPANNLFRTSGQIRAGLRITPIVRGRRRCPKPGGGFFYISPSD
jgi:hypothetical protein